MTRTQVILQSWQHKFLHSLARKRGLSVSGLLREWIEEKAGSLRQPGQDPLFNLVGMIEDRASDVSENADFYLYGDKGSGPR